MKTKLFHLKFCLWSLLVLMMPLVAAGCSSDEDEAVAPVLKLVSNIEVVDAEGGEMEMGLEVLHPISNGQLTVKSDKDWVNGLKYDAASQKLLFTVDANEVTEEREAMVSLSYPKAEKVTLRVVQEAGRKVEPVKFNTAALCVYQTFDDNQTNYYLVLTTCPYTMDEDSQVSLNEPGYKLTLDLYALAEEKGVVPAGKYISDQVAESADHTYGLNYTRVTYEDPNAYKPESYGLASDLNIYYNKKTGEYIIRSSFNHQGDEVPFEYRGTLDLQDVSDDGSSLLPRIEGDVKVEGFEAVATYFGNLLESETGMMSINIMDKTYAEDETEGQNGKAVSLMVFTQLFPQTNLINLVPGTYEVGGHFLKKTWLPGIEINAMGSIMPFGTYAHCDDGTGMGQFLFAESGTITIEAHETGHRIRFDLVAENGHRISGSYDGFVEIVDESNDKNRDDGTSTLTDDHDMDLSPIQTARLFSLGDVEGSDGKVYTHNRIDIGSRGGWDIENVLKTGDTFTMDLVMERDAAGKIVPGTYQVTTDHFPASIIPGAAIRGYIWNGEYVATGWLHYDTEKPQDLYLDGHAAAYDGEITVEKSDLGENYYTFTIDMVCVRKMHVRGTWTGPVIEANSGDPVLPKSVTSFAAPTVKQMPTVIPSAARQWLQNRNARQNTIKKLTF